MDLSVELCADRLHRQESTAETAKLETLLMTAKTTWHTPRRHQKIQTILSTKAN